LSQKRKRGQENWENAGYKQATGIVVRMTEQRARSSALVELKGKKKKKKIMVTKKMIARGKRNVGGKPIANEEKGTALRKGK